MLQQATVLEKIRAHLETVEVVEGEPNDRLVAYAPTQETEADGGVPSVVTPPCVIVLPGRTLEYLLRSDQHRHTYYVRVLVLLGSADFTEGAFVAAVMPDRILEAMSDLVNAAGAANSLVFAESQGLVTLEWGGREYMGYEMLFRASEAASVTPATGE